MPVIYLETFIEASKETCFDLSRSIDLHVLSTKKTGERAIAGRTTGLLQLHETVTWRARHFGVWQNLTSQLTEFNYPDSFVDEMVEGSFQSFRHEHYFNQVEEGTLMIDIFTFTSPLGWLGKLANGLYLTRYMQTLLKERNQVIKNVAEKNKSFLLS